MYKQRRLVQLVLITTLIGMWMCMGLSYKVWFTAIAFPRLPIVALAYDQVLIIGLSSAMALLSLWYLFKPLSRLLPITILLVMGLLFAFDQHLIQPWIWMDFVLILLIIPFAKKYYFYEEVNDVLRSLQLLLGLIYIFSGFYKLNPYYTDYSVAFYLHPITNIFWQIKEEIHTVFSYTSYLEIILGISLLFPIISRYSKFLLIGMHLFILAMIGPLGMNHNEVVWPWNIQMIVLLLVLFPKDQTVFQPEKGKLFINKTAKTTLAGLVILFGLAQFNLANPFLSFDLFSGNLFYPAAKVEKSEIKQIPKFMDEAYVYGDTLYFNYFDYCFKEYRIPPCPGENCKTHTRAQLESLIKE